MLDRAPEADRPAPVVDDHRRVAQVEVGERFAAAVNAPAPRRVERASHFLQEDAGEEIGRSIADWLAA